MRRTLTMVSRTQITLRGCKAWLLCGEKQWLRTSAPPAAVPATAPEGTQQIEASATPGASRSGRAARPPLRALPCRQAERRRAGSAHGRGRRRSGGAAAEAERLLPPLAPPLRRRRRFATRPATATAAVDPPRRPCRSPSLW